MEEVKMKLLDYDALAEKGIKFSDTHIWRLIRAGDFPKPVKIGNRNHLVEAEINQYVADKLAQRDGATVTMEPSHV
jgi:prophage regulatory protein